MNQCFLKLEGELEETESRKCTAHMESTLIESYIDTKALVK